jgi:hypothetical protein
MPKVKKKKKKGFSVSFEKKVKNARKNVKKDIKKKFIAIEKRIPGVKELEKKVESKEFSSFCLTYGWAILVILVCVGGFFWWQYFTSYSEKCDFVDGSGLFCEQLDITTEFISIEIRNLNNNSIKVNQVKLKSCVLKPDQNIPDNDKRMFIVPCNISSGRLKEKIVVGFKTGEFQKHSVAKLTEIVP